jgi:hypothetical protein
LTRHLELLCAPASLTIAALANVRRYSRFSAAADDVVEVRILMGIHFRFADTVGRKQGSAVANWIFQRKLRPIEE